MKKINLLLIVLVRVLEIGALLFLLLFIESIFGLNLPFLVSIVDWILPFTSQLPIPLIEELHFLQRLLSGVLFYALVALSADIADLIREKLAPEQRPVGIQKILVKCIFQENK